MDSYDSKILVSSPIPSSFVNWSIMATPMGAKYFALTTYNSQLVLVGGKCMKHSQSIVTNKLWTWNMKIWEELLPPMQEERYWPSAINVGSPMKAIVVAGGRGKDGKEIDSVEALLGEQWYTVQPLPKKCYGIKTIIYNERLYLVGGTRQGRDIFFCKLRTITDKELLSSKTLWNSFARAPSEGAYMASFQHELVAMIEKDRKMFAYHSFTKYWVHVGDSPPNIRVEALPISFDDDGDVLVVGTTRSQPKQSMLFRITMKGRMHNICVLVCIMIID